MYYIIILCLVVAPDAFKGPARVVQLHRQQELYIYSIYNVYYAHLLWWRLDVTGVVLLVFCLSGVAFPTAAAPAAPVEGRTHGISRTQGQGAHLRVRSRGICVASFASFLPLYITHYRKQ